MNAHHQGALISGRAIYKYPSLHLSLLLLLRKLPTKTLIKKLPYQAAERFARISLKSFFIDGTSFPLDTHFLHTTLKLTMFPYRSRRQPREWLESDSDDFSIGTGLGDDRHRSSDIYRRHNTPFFSRRGAGMRRRRFYSIGEPSDDDCYLSSESSFADEPYHFGRRGGGLGGLFGPGFGRRGGAGAGAGAGAGLFGAERGGNPIRPIRRRPLFGVPTGRLFGPMRATRLDSNPNSDTEDERGRSLRPLGQRRWRDPAFQASDSRNQSPRDSLRDESFGLRTLGHRRFAGSARRDPFLDDL